MNKIEVFIRRLCPQGVKYLALSAVAKISNGKDHKFLPDGEFPVYGSGGIMRYANEYIYKDESVLIPRKGSIGNIYYVEEPFWTVDTIFYTKIDKNIIVPKFLYYFLSTLNLENLNYAGGVPSLTKTILDKLKVPIPPLPVQQEIVNILDKFTQLEAELEAELKARKVQYEYYRDELLNFEEKSVNWKNIKEIADVTKLAGYEFTEHVRYSQTGNIIALRALNIKKGSLNLDDVKYIDKSNFSKLSRSKLYIDDMMFTYVGTIGEVALIDSDDTYYLAPNVARIRFDKGVVNPKFMRYYFESNHFIKNEINRYLSSSSMKNLTMESIRKFKVPVPTLEEQRRLVSFLEPFMKLVHDLSCGLPAEIIARKKQYEYYRNKLLTFKPLVNE